MLKRYCITYVGDDSDNHERFVWAKDHNEAAKKAQARFEDLETVTCIRRTANPLVIWGVVLVVLAIVVAELVH